MARRRHVSTMTESSPNLSASRGRFPNPAAQSHQVCCVCLFHHHPEVSALLSIMFDDVFLAHLGDVGILSGIAASAALTQ